MANKKAPAKKKTSTKAKAKPAEKSVQEKVDAVLAQADKSVGVESVKDIKTYEDEVNTSPAKTLLDDDTAQADYLPGTRRPSMLDIPERVWDDDAGTNRVVTRPKEYHYCWVEGSDINHFKITGYRFCHYDGGGGLSERGFSGTHLFERTISGHVQLGDLYLMYCPIRLYEEMVMEDAAAADRMSRIGETNFHNLGYRHGIRTFSEIDGVPQSN